VTDPAHPASELIDRAEGATPPNPSGTEFYDADDEAQDGPQTGPDSLRDLIVAQGMQETGIFVLLFTSETAAPSPNARPDTLTPSAELVQRKAAELGVDLERLTMFSDDAYLLQAGLGEAVAPEAA
jgi:hypothetical protein